MHAVKAFRYRVCICGDLGLNAKALLFYGRFENLKMCFSSVFGLGFGWFGFEVVLLRNFKGLMFGSDTEVDDNLIQWSVI